eukprot:scaffold5735_cov154-Skeletonema_menzelii.AAC.1
MFFPTCSSPVASTAIILLFSLLQYYSCLSFSPPPLIQQRNTIPSSSIRQHQQLLAPLNAITKRQSLILDGAELSYYMQSLAAELDGDCGGTTPLPDVAPRSLKKNKRVASITFVTAVLEEQIVQKNGEIVETGTRIVGIEAVQQQEEEQQQQQQSHSRGIITIENNVQLYQDSIAVIPPSLKASSDADIISTAAAALSGVHFSSSSSSTTKRKKRAVIVGGGDHAIFLAKALVALNVKTYLVTARPTWSLPSPQDITGRSGRTGSFSEKENLIEIMSPAVGSMSLGFTMAIGEFDILIDTLGDEMGKGRARSIVNTGIGQSSSSLQQWKELHGCTTYISTITRSQQYVLGKGLLFARDAVIRYQEEVESKLTTTTTSSSSSLPNKKKGGGVIPSVPPPRNFGATIQSLLEKHVIYPAGSNEVGSQGGKSTFVRGWSLSDLTELKTWPRASEGAGRFGFPVIDLNAAPGIIRRPSMKEEPKKGVVESAAAVEKTVDSEDGNNKVGANVVVTKEPPSTSSELTSAESMMETTVNATNTTSTRQIKVTKSSTTKIAPSNNPYVTTIHSASELNQDIVEAQRNCILFLTASYCQKCKRLTPQFQRLARKLSSHSSPNNSSSPKNDVVLFAHVDISAGPKGKQLGKLLNVEKVPSVIVFQNGNQVEIDGEESSIVMERGNMNRLEGVVDILDKGESRLKLKDLLSVQEAIQK